MERVKPILKKIYEYIKVNSITFVFIVTSLFSGILIRGNTIGNIWSLKPFLTDLSFILIISYIGHFFSKKNQYRYFIVWSIIFTIVCVVNHIYYSNYISFTSFSLMKTATELTGYTDALLENILELSQCIYIYQVIVVIFMYVQYRRSDEYKKTLKNNKEKKVSTKKYDLKKEIVIFACIFIFFNVMLLTNGTRRLRQQWNRNSIVRDFGIYVYQANDLVTSIKTKVNSVVGYDSAYKEFREYYENKTTNTKKNDYTNILKGKNVLVIHGESIQSFVMNLKFNGKVLTPNINKMAKEGIYFTNFYAQESVGNSSDSEFTSLSSLLPSNCGTVFMNYFNRKYETTLTLLKKEDYYTFSMHANNGSAWNRNVMYDYLGYDDFYCYTKDYEMDETIGLGLSDKSFFRQSVEILKNINREHKKWYGTLIMLTNHTPFSGIEGHSDYVVDYITKERNSETGKLEEVTEEWLEDTKMGNYLKSVNYADEAIGELIKMLDTSGLLDNTVIVLYGDHDCKLKQSEFKKLYENEHYLDVLIDPNNTVGIIDDMNYEINRKVPLIIWSKDIANSKYSKNVDMVAGMIDIMPTLSNMLGITPKYALGNDLFSIKENIVVFPSGNWITNKIYYNSSKENFRALSLDVNIDKDYIDQYNLYAEN